MRRRAAFFNVGDPVVFGKWMNKPGKILRFFDDGKGNPMIEIEPIPKGVKKNKILPLFRIRHQHALKTAERVVERLSTSRVAERYLAAADDMQTMLLKLRKGVTTPIESIGKLKKVLDHLGGWNVEPFVGVVHVLYVGRGVGSLEEMAEVYAIAKKHEVQSLPVSPRVDEVYITDLKAPAPLHSDGPHHVLYCEVWVGAAGFKITSPEGKTYEALPYKGAWDKGNINGDVRKLPKLGPKPLGKFIGSNGYVGWLTRETRFNQQVLDALGMDEHTKAAPRTAENTGSCPCCFRNIKLKASSGLPTMVNHGFKRPGWGRQEGNCGGVGWPPFELSPEGTKHLVSGLTRHREKLVDTLDRIEKGTLDVLVLGTRHFKPDHPGWSAALRLAKTNLPREVEWVTRDIKDLSKLIAGWREQPLPEAGVAVKNWQLEKR